MFELMLARVGEIRLASSAAMEQALQKSQARNCETRDACLRFLAEDTNALYALFVRVRPNALGSQLLLEARVVRSDGVLMRSVSLAQPERDGDPVNETARVLLGRAIDALDLAALSPTLPAAQPTQASQEGVARRAPAVTLEPSRVAPVSPRRPVGFAMLGIGAASLASGGVFAGLAAAGRSGLTPDANGAVPLEQAGRARMVARDGQVATVLIPLGVVIAAIGGVLAWWPSEPRLAVSVAGGREGGSLQVSGLLP
jgi:hypothetical protein